VSTHPGNGIRWVARGEHTHRLQHRQASDAEPRREGALAVEVGTETLSATAAPLQGAERDRAWTVQVSRFPHFAGYQAKTERVIPVVELR
jgi:hypothetical protein